MKAGKPLFSVSNHHVESCREPPAVDGDAPGTYVGYFANEHSEQAIYTFDFETREATLTMGDAGWQVVHPVVHGKVDGLLLTKAELLWLRACWMATGDSCGRAGRPRRPPRPAPKGSSRRNAERS